MHKYLEHWIDTDTDSGTVLQLNGHSQEKVIAYLSLLLAFGRCKIDVFFSLDVWCDEVQTNITHGFKQRNTMKYIK